MNKIIVATVLASSLFMVGCAKEIGRDKLKAEATVIELDYDEEYTQMIPMSTGKTTTLMPQHHDAEYDVTVGYQGVEYEVDNKEVYDKVEHKLYKPVKCKFDIVRYDDGTSRMILTEIEGVQVDEE